MQPIRVPHEELIPSEKTEQVIVDAVRQYVEAVQAEEKDGPLFAITAAGTPWSRSFGVWLSLLSLVILPVLLAEFLAYMARKRQRGENPSEDPEGVVIPWPDGVDAPTTVEELYDVFPWVFDGMPTADIADAAESDQFREELLLWFGATLAALTLIPGNAYRELLVLLGKELNLTAAEKQRVVWEWLKWDTGERPTGWAARALNLARTEVHNARQAAAHAAAMDAAARGVEVMKVWLTAKDDRVRDWHRLAHEQERPLDQPFDVGGEGLMYPGDKINGSLPNWINCVVGSTRVAGPGQDVAACYRRPVTGRFVELRLADSRVLTVTPNHPVLTDTGYVNAGELREGQCVMATRPAGAPDVDHMPPRIDQAFNAIRSTRGSHGVAGSTLDFHGDGTEEEEVEIVSADWELGDHLNAAFEGHFGKHEFVGVGLAQGAGSGASAVGSGAQVPVRVARGGDLSALPSAGSVGGSSVSAALCGSETRHAELVSLAGAADRQAEFPEVAGDGPAGGPEDRAHLQHAHALGMEPTELVRVKHYFGSHDVYNLSTSDNYYIANGIAVHNCRCDAVYYEKASGQTIITAAATKEDAMPNNKMTEARPWSGRLAPIGEQTGDGRVLKPGGTFRFRELPLPLLFQDVTSAGHDNSRIVGVIQQGTITEDGIEGTGVVYADEERVLRLLEDGVLRPSVDMCDVVFEVEENTSDDVMIMSSGTVMGATLVATPAFENVNVTLTAAAEEAVSLVAAAAPPLPTYNAALFEDPQLTQATPLTLERDTGRVYGHLALWDSCHVGMPGRCVSPPRSANNYAAFHQSTIVTDTDRLAVGRLTVGCGHAEPQAGMRAAAEHYDTTGATWAYVRAGEDKHGIWVSGEINPAATAEQLAAAETAPLSGDWRRRGPGLELVAALSVSVPGFPVRREFRADGATVDSLVASASVEATCDGDTAAPGDGMYQRGKRAMSAEQRIEQYLSRHRRNRYERALTILKGQD